MIVKIFCPAMNLLQRGIFFNLLISISNSVGGGLEPTNLKSEMLRLHNEARKQAMSCKLSGQPPAKAMPMLQWHDELAAKAQVLANQCKVGHDTANDRRVSDFRYVGQNWAGTRDIQTGVRMWLEEYKHYDFQTGNCRQGQCGHYTQLVWAETTHVGCAARDCSSSGNYPYGLSIVCNYGPGGNMMGQKPYKVGSQSDCQTGGQGVQPSAGQPSPSTQPSQVPKPQQQYPAPGGQSMQYNYGMGGGYQQRPTPYGYHPYYGGQEYNVPYYDGYNHYWMRRRYGGQGHYGLSKPYGGHNQHGGHKQYFGYEQYSGQNGRPSKHGGW